MHYCHIMRSVNDHIGSGPFITLVLLLLLQFLWPSKQLFHAQMMPRHCSLLEIQARHSALPACHQLHFRSSPCLLLWPFQTVARQWSTTSLSVAVWLLVHLVAARAISHMLIRQPTSPWKLTPPFQRHSSRYLRLVSAELHPSCVCLIYSILLFSSHGAP